MLVSPFEEERARISDRLEKLNRELRSVSVMMEEFKIKYIHSAMRIRRPTTAQKTYNEELEKIKEVDNRESIHNELAKFNI